MPIAFVFTVIAWVYSSVGFGGGSSYLAVLALTSLPYTQIPPVALFCNLIVVSIGFFYFYKYAHFHWRLLLPFIVTSIPCSYLGARLEIPEWFFLALLSVCLLCVGLGMLMSTTDSSPESKNIFFQNLWFKGLPIGVGLGFLAGLLGIGGGIFLSPILHHLKWGRPKEIAATCTAFIGLNSLFGLWGHLSKGFNFVYIGRELWLLPLAVACGALIGARWGAGFAKEGTVKRWTGALVLLVGLRLGFRMFGI